MAKSDIGVFGLGVMGSNLALNMEEHGYRVSVYNRSVPGEEHVLADFLDEYGEGKKISGFDLIKDFVSSLDKPRKILIMVKAGPPVDAVIEQLLPHLDKEDILIDGGNSHFSDTTRRTEELASKDILYVGMGVSGGEKGARQGPSLMPGGASEAWDTVGPLLTSIAAEAPDGSPCCSWIGADGAGHFVKMVHNGIEYADMQLLSEAYFIMKTGLRMDNDEMSERFRSWNDGPLNGYLTEITADILEARDEDGTPLVEKILDSAGQKGTGKWTAISALEEGVPLPMISESVFARFISSFLSIREKASKKLTGPDIFIQKDRDETMADLEKAVLASRMMVLAEGFFLICNVSTGFEWEIDPGTVAKVWRGGCIIRSALLETIVRAFEDDPELKHLLLAASFADRLAELQIGWRSTVSTAVKHGIPAPAMTSALSQYDALRSERLPANLIQAQRDYFGAHSYERLDKPRGTFFHTDWRNLKR